ncbi:MAG TPA: lactonase family protein [Pararhizobium sp.]|nr:lactonase family protein [Pararhizobium sp.]
MPKTFLYVGCCNRETPYFATSNGKGIAVFEIDLDSGHLEPVGVQEGIDNPTFLSVDAAGTRLYANSEVFGWNEGVVSAYDIDRATGRLDYINKQAAQGSITAFNSSDRSGRYLLVANYGMSPVADRPNRSVISFPIRADGGLGAAAGSAAHEGKGIDPERQERPHAHSIRISPDNRFAVAADLGIDALVSYAFDEASGHLERVATFRLPEGSGPRHFVFDPAAPRAYVVNELNSTVCSLAYDAESGALALLDSCATVPGEATGNHCSEITLAPSGKRLFVANRGHDSIATIAIDPEIGKLRLEANTPAGGKTPRHMAIDPSGQFLVVANQDSDRLAVFCLSGADEALSSVGGTSTGTPTCVAFLPFGA